MEWTRRACTVLQSADLDRNTFRRIIDERPFMQGALEVLQALADDGVIIALITGSFRELAERVSKLVRADYALAHCTLIFDEKDRLQSWELQKTDYDDKGAWLRKLMREHKIPAESCAYIGDDVNDTGAFEAAGLSIAFNAEKADVRRAAKVVIDSRNLKAVLPHLSK